MPSGTTTTPTQLDLGTQLGTLPPIEPNARPGGPILNLSTQPNARYSHPESSQPVCYLNSNAPPKHPRLSQMHIAESP